jgi:lipopolysaccharide transport system permease protein
MLVFTLVFGRIAKLPSEGAPYSLLVLSGMLPWFFFASAVSDGSQSLVLNSNLLSKVYFPRLAVPVSSIAVALVDFVIGLAALLAFMAAFGYWPTWRLVFVPLFFVLALASALGLALWFSALNVKYRDFQFVIPFVVLFGLYVSPIGFSTTVVPERWLLLYSLNPMVGVIEGCRWAFLGGDFVLRADALALSLVLGIVLLTSGIWFFRRTERSFADVI